MRLTALASARRRFTSEDRYYWITSLLAARGHQRATCRLTALNILGCGTVPLVLMLGDHGPTGARDRFLAVTVFAISAALAATWLRSSWPTRRGSQLCVVICAILLTVGCLIENDPALGLLGATGFIALSTFTAVFHAGWLLAYTWIVGVATIVVQSVRFAGVAPEVTVGAIALFAFVNAFVVFCCRSVVRLVDSDVHYGELEPLTGLLTRDAFSERVATVVTRDRDDDRFLAIVVVSLDSFSLLTAMGGEAGGNQARVAVGQRLRETLRRDALLAHVGESEYLIADTFSSTDASVLTDRLQHTVRTAPFRLTASIGTVVAPLAELVGHPPHDVVEELITIASTNVYLARRNGGQRTETTANPELTSLRETNGWDDDDLTA
ncbi:GGDEF domain-containing protein [Mycobacterium yunnanensis]|uniref:GGDEF domain-containing protein n=1 Tax=Mycobacterium yunnanensis TaxID=368477 RepID=A0A9X2YVD1_9MYCO|nr:GGDEF domain-containing protein [Mycobacterium yunnanensis]MCV7419343.1 GGDEF domain-containing protein [Mycobacterium yunnanensis]